MARSERFPDCEYARETDNSGIVDCAKGGTPHVGVCANCDQTGEPKPRRPDGRIDLTGCESCKEKLMKGMKEKDE